MNIEQIKNTLREFQAENKKKFKNTQAELKKAVSCIKKKCTLLCFLIRTDSFFVSVTLLSRQKPHGR